MIRAAVGESNTSAIMARVAGARAYKKHIRTVREVLIPREAADTVSLTVVSFIPDAASDTAKPHTDRICSSSPSPSAPILRDRYDENISPTPRMSRDTDVSIQVSAISFFVFMSYIYTKADRNMPPACADGIVFLYAQYLRISQAVSGLYRLCRLPRR